MHTGPMTMLRVQLLLFALPLIGCLNVTQWRRDGGDLQHLTQSPDTGDLYVGALNNIYQLSADLNLTHQADTRWNATTDDLSTTVILNRTLTETYQITTCGSSRVVCQIRNSSDITSVIGTFTPASHSSGSRAFSVPFAGKNHAFIACPHSDNVQHGLACESPGIVWRTQLRDGSVDDRDIHFKSITSTPVTTTNFVAAFPVRQYRLFFSVQTYRAKTDRPARPARPARPNYRNQHRKWSRIAQICQMDDLQIPVERTVYVDMEIKCAGYTEITAAKYIEVDSQIYVVAAFRKLSKRPESAICVYQLVDIEKRFVDNIYDCYNGSHSSPSEDYIGTAGIMCRQAVLNLTTLSNDVFLCNTYDLNLYNRVIGTKVLDGTPSVEYNDTEITGLALLVRQSEILAYIGTKDGYLLKAVVHPPENGRRLDDFTIDVSEGDPIGGDMYMDRGNNNVLLMTSHKIVKVHVEYCSYIRGCQQCLQGRDPYCGWCLLDNRCSTAEMCGSDWLSTTANSTCPTILSVSPAILSVNSHMPLDMHISHLPRNVRLTCLFITSDPEFKEPTIAVAVNDTVIMCQSPNIQQFARNMTEGSLTVTIGIVSNITSEPFVEGTMTYFNCETFSSCTTCTQKKWHCDWCLYDNACVTADGSCNRRGHVRSLHEANTTVTRCPVVNTVHDIVEIMDSNKTLYIPTDDSRYDVTVDGQYLPQPQHGQRYSCEAYLDQKVSFPATWLNDTAVTCALNRSLYDIHDGYARSEIRLAWDGHIVDGHAFIAIFYHCQQLVKPAENCGKCKSYMTYEPYYHCWWCRGQCAYTYSERCRGSSMSELCPAPTIHKIYPASIHVNASTIIDITGINLGSTFTEINNTVDVDEIPCVAIEDKYRPSERISCRVQADGRVQDHRVTVRLANRLVVRSDQVISFRVPVINAIEPTIGPLSGGTKLTIHGEYLNTGREQTATIGRIHCNPIRLLSNSMFECKNNASRDETRRLRVAMAFDGQVEEGVNATFSYLPDPVIMTISPRSSFDSGGRRVTVHGSNLHTIQEPRLYIKYRGAESVSTNCTRATEGEEDIYCEMPMFHGMRHNLRLNYHHISARSVDTHRARMGFVMDDVGTVRHLPEDIATLTYYCDPMVYQFAFPEKYQKWLEIKGERLAVAANQSDVKVFIGPANCNITTLANDAIICIPPVQRPLSMSVMANNFPITVLIGYWQQSAGLLDYGSDTLSGPLDPERMKEYTIAGTVVGVLLLLLFIVTVALLVMVRKRRATKQEKESVQYRMDKLEATFRTQCREEFAALQTAVSDLTSDLEGGKVLFRDYDVYACKVLFPTNPADPALSPPALPSSVTDQSIEAFRGLLRNSQFLLTFIKTLESQKTFTIQDRSNVASQLVVINHDNMEYITEILKQLLHDLVDKVVAAGTPKLMLRRSECVVEKLIQHWLSICLYDYLKESSGSTLYILYKVISIQVGKGPVDYITNCGKYTLSEDRLLPAGDSEINPQMLTLHVSYNDLIDGDTKNVSVEVLDCDTITQMKRKVLEILYKNVPFSNIPSVHGFLLETKEADGTSRMMHDEDGSSEKDGFWKKINTLQHYDIKDGTHITLSLNQQSSLNILEVPGASPESYIIGSIKRSKQVVRTLSGSNFFHLTKQHHGEDDVKLSSDLFLPRLLNTKGTLQKYIDDLFEEMLKVGDDPPLIIKYLFDYLDTCAARCDITDADVLHTWKCNSLLLRFWVNIIKNPEFVFDIHKPYILDSCLSVVAQTLMDSCSTAALQLGKHSPSNKLLFAKDIPRYKDMVGKFFSQVREKPAISDQELNSYITQHVSQKFGGKMYPTSALLEMYKYATQYRDEILCRLDSNAEDPSHTSLASKLRKVYNAMDNVDGCLLNKL